MKNILKIHVISLAIVFASCTDLEEIPVGRLSPKGYFNSADEIELALYGAYGTMAHIDLYGNDLTAALLLLSDMVDLGFYYSNYGDFNDFSHMPTNTYVAGIWEGSYELIEIANMVLSVVDQIDEDQETKDRYEAEARWVRAFSHYNLVRLYGEIPYLTEPVGDFKTVTKSSVDYVYEGIIEDLGFAKEHLPMQHPNNDVRSRPSAGTAATVLASVYLTREQWQEAYDNAKWVIDNAGELNYALEPDFQDLFRWDKQDLSKEIIFSADFIGDQQVSGYNNNNVNTFQGIEMESNSMFGIAGWSMLVPSLKVYETWDPADYRRKVSMSDTTMIKDSTRIDYTQFLIARPHAVKYNRFGGTIKGGEAGWRSDQNQIIFRYAEVLLIAAEAGNEIGKTDEAAGYVNQVRARARAGGDINEIGTGYGSYGPSASPADAPAGIGQSDFRKLVLEERRIELAFEFKRWFDIVRRDLGDEAFGPDGLEPQPNFDKSKHYLLPYPQTEIDIAPNLLPQNNGY
jgi:hypothetical protein